MATTNIEFIQFYGVELEVHFTYSLDEGYSRNSNGDGLPPSLDFEIENVYIKGEDVSELIYAGSLWKELENRILETLNQ